MSSAADRIKANAERAAAARAAKAAGSKGTGRSAGAPAKPEPRAHGAAVRQKPIRRTVDLPPELYRRLVDWQGTAAEQLGQSRVTSQDVFVALVYELLSDPDTANSVMDRLGGS